MANDALTLAKAIHQRTHKRELTTNEVLLTVFATMDAMEQKYLQSHADLLRQVESLKAQLHRTTTKGDAE